MEFSFFPAGGLSHPSLDTRTKGWPPYGPSLLSFGLDTGVGGYLAEKRKIPSIPVCKRIEYKKDQSGFSFFAASKHPIPSRRHLFGGGFGRYWEGG